MTIRIINNAASAVSNFVEANVDSVFVITANIDVAGATLTMPANSSLDFRPDASLYNCTFTGNKATNSYVDFRWFKSNGQNSDNEDFNALSNAIALSDNVFVHGNCKFSESIFIRRSGVRIFGSNPKSASIILTQVSGDNLINVAASVNNFTIENVTLRMSYIVGSEDRTVSELKKTPAYLLYAQGCNCNLTVRGCVFDTATGGIFVNPGSQFVTVYGCVFRNMVFCPNSVAGGYGVVLHHENAECISGSDHIEVTNCIFESTVIRHALYAQASNDVLFKDNIVYGTTEFNDAALIARYMSSINVTTNNANLAECDVEAVDVTKHLTVYDSAIQFRGGANLRIINNYFCGGIVLIDGENIPLGNELIKGRFFLLKDNVIKDFSVPHYNDNSPLYNLHSGIVDDFRLIDNVEVNITYAVEQN